MVGVESEGGKEKFFPQQRLYKEVKKRQVLRERSGN